MLGSEGDLIFVEFLLKPPILGAFLKTFYGIEVVPVFMSVVPVRTELTQSLFSAVQEKVSTVSRCLILVL